MTYTETTPAPSCRTPATRSRCRARPPRAARRAVPQQQGRDHDVEHRPGPPGGRVVDEVRAGGELVREGERDGQVGVQVHVVPGLVAHAAPGGPGGGRSDRHQQREGDGRHHHVGVAHQQLVALVDDAGVCRHRVTPDDQQRVRDREADDVAPAVRVPAGEPVGADPALDHGYAGHQRQQDHDAVAGQQSGDPAGVGEPVAQARDRDRVVPPQRQDPDRARSDQREQGPRRYPGQLGRGGRREPRPGPWPRAGAVSGGRTHCLLSLPPGPRQGRVHVLVRPPIMRQKWISCLAGILRRRLVPVFFAQL